MNHDQDLDAVYAVLKSSPHWRADFKVVAAEDVGAGKTVYRVQADDQEPSTILAIARLNEALEGKIL